MAINYECIENKELCAKCQGACCKGCGCTYVSSDLESLKFDYLDQLLQTGTVSIVAHLAFKFNANGRPYTAPTLYLRVRNIERDIIDLVSVTSTCSVLTSEGCPYDFEHRPTGGKTIIPCYPAPCQNSLNHDEILKTWEPYQKVLQKLVKKYSGMNVVAKIRQDIEELSYKLISENFSKNDNTVSADNLFGMLMDFYAVYPEEVDRGFARANANIFSRKLNKNQ